jgi:hypothetical protein
MTTVHAQPAYQMQINQPPPPGYPTEYVADERTAVPTGSYDTRKQDLLAHIRRNPAPNNTKMAYYELARLAAGGAPHEGVFHAAMDFIDDRKDCSDFVLHSILRLLYWENRNWGVEKKQVSHPQSPISKDVFSRARTTVLSFKYWPDEPGIDSLCTWTENHHILFASAAYLAGQLYPDETFTNSGQTGCEKMTINRPRILRWLDLRFHTGFSEWLSHVYYDEDLTALLSLVDFCEDPEIVQKATMVIDLILLDMALNSFKGVFGSTHGRSYENTKKWASNEGTTDTQKLLFGMGQYSGFDCMSAINLALSLRYRLPPVIAAIAQDGQRPEMENRQRMGIIVKDELERMKDEDDGISFETGMTMLTLEAYLHPQMVETTMQMFDAYNWWENNFFSPFQPYQKLLSVLRKLRLIKPLAEALTWDLCRNTREQVNITTYRTPDAMLSCAQDYRPGYGGDQQHIWQATLGADAVCFTTHPAKIEGASPNYWAGSGQLPRAAQLKNVVICIYNLHQKPALYVPTKLFYTHAWLPKDQFDEVVERDQWIFARKGNGYLALRSQRPFYWKTDDQHTGAEAQRHAPEDVGREVIAPGKRNIWICELGRRETDGEFKEFVARVATAVMRFESLTVQYESPSQGRLEFGWERPFTQNGQPVQLHGYPRYDNPYVHADFAAAEIKIAMGEERLTLNWATRERIVL